jgi:hypothetical protein
LLIFCSDCKSNLNSNARQLYAIVAQKIKRGREMI